MSEFSDRFRRRVASTANIGLIRAWRLGLSVIGVNSSGLSAPDARTRKVCFRLNYRKPVWFIQSSICISKQVCMCMLLCVCVCVCFMCICVSDCGRLCVCVLLVTRKNGWARICDSVDLTKWTFHIYIYIYIYISTYTSYIWTQQQKLRVFHSLYNYLIVTEKCP